MAKSKRKSKSQGVPGRRKGESLRAYHDRLAALAYEAEKAGDEKRSARLQKKAGELAARDPKVAKEKRKGAKSGPGTYPWRQCVDDQIGRGYGQKRADAICGRIRADSRARYPEYWAAREGKGAQNPALGHTGKPPGKPHAALALDGGPRGEPRDLIVVLDRNGTILDLREVLGDHSLRDFERTYPDLPIYGPLRVLASDVREIRRAASSPEAVIVRNQP